MNKKLEKMLKKYLAADKAVDDGIGLVATWENILCQRKRRRNEVHKEVVDYIQKSNVGNRFLEVEANLKTPAIRQYINEK